ncbi:MAG: YciI family protein [Boseongicola sp.]|nr:YciI family protein [Boseongicola sp.]
MVAWNDYKAIAKDRGALALELYVVESTPQKAPDDVKQCLPVHLEYQRVLEQRGVLVLAGPLSDPTGESMEGAGLIVYRAGSMAEAKRLAEDDPMHQGGARGFTLRKWLVNEGSVSLSVGLSTGKAQLS